MKTKIFILLSAITIALAACNLTNTNNRTPEIGVLNIISNKSDTLIAHLTDEGGVYKLDTIHVGDTVLFKVVLNGYYNNLSEFLLANSDTASTTLLFPTQTSLDSVFSKTKSDITKGYFQFLPNYKSIYLPVRYVAKKESSDATLSFYLSSDAEFDAGFSYNSVSFKIKTPILSK